MHSDNEMVNLRSVIETLLYMVDEEESDGVEEVMQLPSIDIVFCKECKYWHKNRKEGDGMNVFDVCYDFQADDFCSYGERKESE